MQQISLDNRIAVPEYLPERFKYYGIYEDGNYPRPDGVKTIRQLWYDSENYELLLVTQSMIDDRDYENEIKFTDGLESSGKISDNFTWAKYACSYSITKNNMAIDGYMLMNGESKRDEYEKILKSLA